MTALTEVMKMSVVKDFLAVSINSLLFLQTPGSITLFFKDNYMKLYEKNFATASFSREVFNGLNMTAAVEYAERKPLFNTTDYTVIKKMKTH